MALTTGARTKLATGAVNWAADDIRARLLLASDPADETITSLTDVGIAGSDTAVSGRALTVDPIQKTARFVTEPYTIFPASTGQEIDRAVLFKWNTSDADAEPLAIVTFLAQTTDGRQMRVGWDSEGVIWVNLAALPPDEGTYAPATYSRSSDLTTALIAAKASIVRRDSAGNPSESGKIGILGLGMSIAEDSNPLTREAFRDGTANGVALSWLPARAAGVGYQWGSDSGKVADNWANPDDACWTYAIGRLSAGYHPVTVYQVQHIHIHLTQSWPESSGWRSGEGVVTPVGQMTADQVTDIVLHAKAKFPNLVTMDISGIPWTGNSTSGQVPIAMVHDDDALLASLAGTHHGVVVDYLQVYADGDTYNSQHTTPEFPSGINWVTPDDYDTDNIHQSVPVGVTKLSNWILSRWVADTAAKSWMWA